MVQSKSKGQSLVELLMALFVVALVIVAVVGVSTASIRNSSYAKNSSEARRYAEEAMEWFRQIRDQKWNTFRARASNNIDNPNVLCLSGTLPELPDNNWWSDVKDSCEATEYISGTLFKRHAYLTRWGPSTEGDLGDVEDTENVVYVKVVVDWVDSQGSHDITLTTQLYNINQ